LKKCTKCWVEKDLSDFTRDCSRADGLRNECRDCRRAFKRSWYSKNQPKIRARERDWSIRTGRVRSDEQRAADEKALAVDREERRVRRTERAQAKAKAKQARIDSYYKKCTRCQAFKHKVDFHNATGTFDGLARKCKDCINDHRSMAAQIKPQLLQLFRACFKCGSTKSLEVDHHVPISKGGMLGIENAVLLCRDCNLKKQNKMPHEFYSLKEARRLLITHPFLH
jgi:5-methylcytosine-specific restriction endonuclease McrA